MKKRTGKMISLSLAVAMAMTAAPVTVLAVNEPVQNASELKRAQNEGEKETDTTTVDTKEEVGLTQREPATTLGETPKNDAKVGEVTTVEGLELAIQTADKNDTITIGNDLEINKTITVNKAVTITANANVTITVGSSQTTFALSNGATLKGLHIVNKDATDTTSNKNIVTVGNNSTVTNCIFEGNYTQGDNQVLRATAVSPGVTGFLIEGNTIRNLRQPGYIEGEGTISGNYVENTRGWVVCATADPTLQNNKFKDNAIDIAIIANGATEDNTNFKNAIDDLSAANNDAYVEHQVLKASAADGVYFVEEGNANATMDGALKDAKDGDTIKLKTNITVASTGSDANQDPAINITKAITLDGDRYTITPSDNFKSDNSLIGISGAKGNDTTPVVIKNLTLDGENKDYVKHALNLYESTGVVIDNVTTKNITKGYGLVVNSSEATVKSMDITADSTNSWGAVNVDTRTDENSKLVIEDGNFSGLNSVFVEHSKETTDDGTKTGKSSVVINGGTFQAPVASNAEDAAFDISGGNFQAATGGKGTSFNVTGGTFAQDFTVEADKLTINGGTFEKDVANEKADATNTITGGNFKTPPTLLPEYMTIVNGKVVVKPGNGFLKQAIDNANDGDTLCLTTGEYTLNDNVCMTLDKELTISGEGSGTVVKGSISIDYGNGLFTFAAGSEGSTLENMTIKYTATGAQTSAVYFNDAFAGTEAASTTIRNVDFKGGESLDSIGKEVAITSTYLNDGCGSLNISDCNFKNFAYAMYFNNISDLTVEDCVIDGTKYNAINIAADGDDRTSSNITLTGNTLTNISYANYEHDAYSSGIRLGKNISDKPVVTDNKITMLNNKKPILVEESTLGTAKYVVLYKDGNTVIGQEIVEDGHSITLPNAPASSRTFRGWYNSEDGKTYQPKEDVNITKDTTFTAQWKSSGGSSHRYDGYITVINPKNGEVSVSSDWADEGDKITLTITPDKGYVVDKIEIVDLEGDPVTAKKVEDKDNKYTFRMENCDVTVTVTFKEEGKTTEDTGKEEDKDEETTETTELNFTDVKESDWFFKGVEYVVDKGIMSGVSENEFAPSGKLTRAMLVQMLYNMESRPACDAENAFMDVPVGQWYTDAVIWANDAKIVSGMGEGLFAPNMEITREQMVAMLYNYTKYKGYDVTASADLSAFADTASVSAWAQPAMQWAVAEGYISGMGDSQLAPQGTATRAEIASVIMRFMEATAETAE